MKKQQGQSLIEVLIAFTIVVIVITTITFATTNSLKNSQYSRNQTLALQYAQQGMDVMKNMRYTDYVTFSKLLAQSYCLDDTCTGITNQSGNCGPVASQCVSTPNIPAANPVFIRQVALQPNAIDCSSPTATNGTGTKVTVSVAWTDGQCLGNSYCHQVATSSCITSYDVVPAP